MKLLDVMKRYRIRQVDVRNALIKRYGEIVIHPSRMSHIVRGMEKITDIQARRVRSVLQHDFDVPVDLVSQIIELRR